jgi:hypothetical protein
VYDATACGDVRQNPTEVLAMAITVDGESRTT